MKSITRRKILSGAGRLGAALTAGLPVLEAASEAQPVWPQAGGPRLKIVVAGGHPGDPEYGCGGTIARYSNTGHDVVLLYLNNGEWPARLGGAPAATRLAEARKACEILKARPAFAGQINGKAVVDPAHYDQYEKILEAERPDIVLTQWPIDHHPDHRATWALTYGAWLGMGKRFALYYYEVSDGEDTMQFSPTHYVDITEVTARKRAACYAHASQAPDKFYALQDQVARFRGIERGCQRAEAYVHQVQSPPASLPSGVAGSAPLL
jgi:LmbE family N-acetylglucosaminyl deacetylase